MLFNVLSSVRNRNIVKFFDVGNIYHSCADINIDAILEISKLEYFNRFLLFAHDIYATNCTDWNLMCLHILAL